MLTSSVGETTMICRKNCRPRAEFSLICVDADERVHQAVERTLAEREYPVRLAGSAYSSAEAVDMALRIRPDIVILDIQMEAYSGDALALQLQGLLEVDSLFVCLTDRENFDSARLAVRIGAVDLIPKPVNASEMAAALGKAVTNLRTIRTHEQERQALERKLGEEILRPPALPRNTRSRSSQIAQAVRGYVETHYAENVSLQTAADYVRLSASYLGPLFKAVCGVSFRTYLRLVRVAKAKELMADPTLNLSEIAQRVGFDDENYFSQVFLELTGRRPGQYRNSCLRQQ